MFDLAPCRNKYAELILSFHNLGSKNLSVLLRLGRLWCDIALVLRYLNHHKERNL